MPRKNSKELIAISIYQLMHRLPYNKINIKLICDNAGVSRMSFYRYYSAKEDIFINYSDERFAEFYEMYMENNDNLTVASFARNLISYFRRFSRQIKVLEKADQLPILLTQFEHYCAYLMNHGKTMKLFKYKDNPIAVPYFAGGLFNVLVYWCKHDFKESEEEMTARLFDLISPRVQE